MLGLTITLFMTGITCFFIGREYDRLIRRVNYNRQLRREQEDKIRRRNEAARIQDEERAKHDFIYNVKYSAPGR